VPKVIGREIRRHEEGGTKKELQRVETRGICLPR